MVPSRKTGGELMGSLPQGISASRGSAVLGVNKYKSPLVAWLEIMEQLKPGFCANNGYETPERVDPWAEPLNPKHASLRWGLAFENSIVDLVGGITGREKYYETYKHGFPMTCHLDGLKNGIVQENKTAFDMAFKMGWGEPGSDMIPESYQVQVQHQMYLAGINNADVNVLVFPKSPAEWEKMGYKIEKEADFFMGIQHPNNGALESFPEFAGKLRDLGYFHKYHVKANPETQAAIIDRYVEFWNENVLKEVPPPVQGYDDIKWLIAAPEGEIEASNEMKELWSEYVDIDNEIESMVESKKEIKNNFSVWIQKEIQSKNVKPGNEKRKLNVYAGRRKLFSITKAYPGLKIAAKLVDTLKENDPTLYETMKKTSFADIMPEELELTEKQLEKVKQANDYLDNVSEQIENGHECSELDFERVVKEIKTQQIKLVKSLKLTKLLSKDSIMKHLEKHKPELFKLFYEKGIVEMSEPKSTLRISKPEKE
jgi:predicted phage-related endonuclease